MVIGIVLLCVVIGELPSVRSEIATHFLVERSPEPPGPDGKAYFYCEYYDRDKRQWCYSNIVGLDTWHGNHLRKTST